MADTKLRDSLAQILADTYALVVKTHAAHWNVTGAGFFELHAAFGAQYQALLAAADELAERIRALGDAAPAGMRALAKATRIEDSAGSEGRALAQLLRDDHRALSRACGKLVKAAQKAGDEASADLLIQRIDAHDKDAWMLDAYAAR